MAYYNELSHADTRCIIIYLSNDKGKSDEVHLMKLLALSDLHGNYSKVEAIKNRAGKTDAVLIVGDITNFGPDSDANKLIDMFDVPILAIPGNCDHPGILEILDNSEAINLHNTCHTIGEVDFIGLGGSNTTPFNTPFEMTDKEIERSLDDLLDKSSALITVLLSHAPPQGFVDELPIGHVGSPAIRKFIDRLSLIVCGHIHEARGIAKKGNTSIVNVGEASKGYGALITIDDNICIELIEV
jgi:Icc-related predicted phosphoesterase